jgi:hypothetical protein
VPVSSQESEWSCISARGTNLDYFYDISIEFYQKILKGSPKIAKKKKKEDKSTINVFLKQLLLCFDINISTFHFFFRSYSYFIEVSMDVCSQKQNILMFFFIISV